MRNRSRLTTGETQERQEIQPPPRRALRITARSAEWALCRFLHNAHLIRDLASVAAISSQRAWAAGLAELLVEINRACDDARARGLKTLSPAVKRSFSSRYDELVDKAIRLNPEPRQRKRSPLERQSYNLAIAFQTHKRSILAYLHHLDLPMTNNQAERDLRPVKLLVYRPSEAGLRVAA